MAHSRRNFILANLGEFPGFANRRLAEPAYLSSFALELSQFDQAGLARLGLSALHHQHRSSNCPDDGNP